MKKIKEQKKCPIRQNQKDLKNSCTTCRFAVSEKLLQAAKNSDPKSLFQIGLQALTEKRYGFAIAFARLAEQAGHTDASFLLKKIRQQLLEETDLKLHENCPYHTSKEKLS